MKIIFKEGTPNMKYQRFSVEYSHNRFRSASEMTDDLINMVVLSFLHNRIYYTDDPPYRFEGFHCKYGRGVNDLDTIIFYFRPYNKLTKIFHGEWLSIDSYHDTFSSFAELNWELIYGD